MRLFICVILLLSCSGCCIQINHWEPHADAPRTDKPEADKEAVRPAD